MHSTKMFVDNISNKQLYLIPIVETAFKHGR